MLRGQSPSILSRCSEKFRGACILVRIIGKSSECDFAPRQLDLFVQERDIVLLIKARIH